MPKSTVNCGIVSLVNLRAILKIVDEQNEVGRCWRIRILPVDAVSGRQDLIIAKQRSTAEKLAV
jgi:hypothetical protein